MAVIYSKYKLKIKDDFMFDGTLKYMNAQTLQITGIIDTTAGDDGGLYTNYEPLYDYQTSERPDPLYVRRAGWIKYDDSVEQAMVYLVTLVTQSGQQYTPRIRVNTLYGSRYQIGDSFGSLYGRYAVTNCEIATNIPIFETEAEAEAYILTGTNFEDAINYKPNELPEDRKKYFIYNEYRYGTPSYAGIEFSGDIYYRYEEFEIDGRACLYVQPDKSLRISTSGEVIVSRFGSNPYTFDVEQPALIYQYPFYNVWNGSSLDEMYYDTRQILRTNMFIIDNEENAEDFVNATTEDEANATAYNHAQNYNVVTTGEWDSPYNPTGETEQSTTFGQVTHTKAFSRQYACTKGALSEIKNLLYDNQTGGIIEDIKKGLELFGDNPVESIVDLSYYPFDISNVINVGASQQYVYFGGYKMDLTTNNVKQVINANGYIDLGSFTFLPTFRNWRDYPPYTKLYFYCPYCAIYELDISRYIGKTINVRFYVDFDTRACMCCLIAGGVLMDYFTGQIGVAQPLRATDFSSYAESQIGKVIKGASDTMRYAGVGAFIGGMFGGVGAPIGAGIGIMAGIGKTAFETNTNNINNFTKDTGNAGSTLSEFLPQYPYFIIQIDDIKEPDNMEGLIGRPSNAGGTLSSFGGYFEASMVNLKCGKATEEEKAEIISLLQSGVYI